MNIRLILAIVAAIVLLLLVSIFTSTSILYNFSSLVGSWMGIYCFFGIYGAFKKIKIFKVQYVINVLALSLLHVLYRIFITQ
jgi:hypothetical protein